MTLSVKFNGLLIYNIGAYTAFFSATVYMYRKLICFLAYVCAV